MRQNLGEGEDGAGEDPLEGEVSAGGGECDAVGVEGETNGRRSGDSSIGGRCSSLLGCAGA